MKRILFFVFLAGFLLSCAAQGPVIISSPAPQGPLPKPGESTSSIPSPRYAPPIYSYLFMARFFNILPYPVKLILRPNEEYYISSTQEYSIPFEKGIESRTVYVHGVILDPKSADSPREMKAAGTFEGRVRIPAREDSESEGSIVIDRITEFRYLREGKR